MLTFPTRTNRRRHFRPAVECLEDRTVPSITLPDRVGSATATALAVDLQTSPRQVLTDFLSATDVDVYRVQLQKEEFLAVDVDPKPITNILGIPVGGLGSSQLTILNVAGSVLKTVGASPEPDTGVQTKNPATLFQAPATGTYYLKLTTTGFGAYQIDLHRIGLPQGRPNPAALQTAGSMYAFLKGNSLALTGPTGYGFALVGAWTQIATAASNGREADTYTATGTVQLQTAFGAIPLPVPPDKPFTVQTAASTMGHTFGEVSSIQLSAGLPLGSFGAAVQQKLGLNLSSFVSLSDKWRILLGSDIKTQYGPVYGIKQVLDSVPYIVYADKAGFNAQFGNISVVDSASADEALLVADPADPFVYIKPKNKDFAFAGSLGGMIPFKPDRVPTGPVATTLSRFFGHVYASGSFPLTGLPLSVQGDVTVNLDANRDGNFLALRGNASQLFKGDLFKPTNPVTAIDAVFKDIAVGVNGAVVLGYKFAGFNFTVPLGAASAVYNGPQQGLWLKAVKGDPGANPFAGTPFALLVMSQTDSVEGWILRNGQFHMTVGTTYTWGDPNSYGATLGYALTLTNAGVTADLRGHAHWEESILGYDVWADATLTASLHVSISAGVLHYTGSAKATGEVHYYAPWPLPDSASFTVDGKVQGSQLIFGIPHLDDVVINLL